MPDRPSLFKVCYQIRSSGEVARHAWRALWRQGRFKAGKKSLPATAGFGGMPGIGGLRPGRAVFGPLVLPRLGVLTMSSDEFMLRQRKSLFPGASVS